MTCDKNCFHCPYPDCIRNEKQDAVESTAEYRRKYPDRVKNTRHKQYEKNRDKEIEYQRNYYSELKNSDRYAEYRRKRNEYLREYRARKKAERVS